jgi:energy-coupling factor transporter ATP-binding protein EcfA2
MGSLQREYERFLSWLSQQSGEPDEIKLANLVHANLEEIAAVGVHKGKRSILIVQNAQSDLDNATDQLPIVSRDAPSAEIPWQHLKHLDVGPFRGFSRSESFDFDRRIILVYGPNGSGKSSLCEALEYALLGTVGEAEARRMDQPAYLTNARVGSFQPPNLVATATGATGEPLKVSVDEGAFRFCFVEKNRIDAFSRMAAKTPSERSRLIATLFGVENFDEFVRGFNESLDLYLDLAGKKGQELEQARTDLAADLTLVREEPTKRQSLNQEEACLAESFEHDLTYKELILKLGTSDHPGRLKEIQDQLDQSPSTEIGLTVATLDMHLEKAIAAHATKVKIDEELGQHRNEISFKQLYQAVQALQANSPDRCPACDTPLQGAQAVVQNPYEKAQSGLATLGELAKLETRKAEAVSEASRTSTELRADLKIIEAFSDNHDSLNLQISQTIQTIPEEPQGNWWQFLFEEIDDTGPMWGPIRAVTSTIGQHDEITRAAEAEREQLRKERARLQEFNSLVIAQQTKRTEWMDSLRKAKDRIAEFEEANLPLVKAVEAEVPMVAKNLRIKMAYDVFLTHLKRYRDELPATLVADLNETAKVLYNGFNRNDPESDQLVELRLPLTAADQIEVIFAGNPELRLDALHVMSEGHIRCLGLSILIAKNIKLGCPLLVFDDAVNAIDDDHRSGMSHTLFDGYHLREKQIVLTCHGEEFIKIIKNELSAETVENDCRFYVFLPHEGDNIIQVDTMPASRNYILAAQESFSKCEIRGALSIARRAMENLNQRTWARLKKRGHGTLRLTFDGPKARFDAQDLANGICKQLRQQTLVDDMKEPLLAGFETLLGALEWSYLNAGTHEGSDINEFDRAIVARILAALRSIDKALK